MLRCHMLIGARSESEGGCPEVGVQTWTILGPKNRFIGKIFPPENERMLSEKKLNHFERVYVSFRAGITPLVVGVVMPQIPQLKFAPENRPNRPQKGSRSPVVRATTFQRLSP